MPALAQSRSTLPHSLVARSTIAVTCPNLETSAPSAIAVPPALRISSTTFSAGVSELPVPSRAPPKSFTTTLAPRLASPSACARPRPLPAPVTMATRPSNLIVMIVRSQSSSEIDQAEPVGNDRGLVLALDLDPHIGERLQLGGLAQLRFLQDETAAHALARAHRRDEAQPVEAVVDPHGGAFDDRHHLIIHDAHQR